MKWTNPGHEFDGFFAEWNSEKKFYLWGAGNSGQKFISMYGSILDIKAFTDSDASKYDTTFSGLPVFDVKKIIPLQRNFKIIVTSTAYWQIKPILLHYGLKENLDFCNFQLFNSVYNLYEYNQLILYRLDIALTNRCTLRCRDCNMMIPYFKNPSHRSFDQIRQDLNIFFEQVDYLEKLNLLGGEPFLYPDIPSVLDFLHQNFRSRIGKIEFFTNATIIPDIDILKLCKDYNISFQISDYSHHIPRLKKKVSDFIELVNKYKIPYTVLTLDKWLDFCLLKQDKKDFSEENMIDFFDLCNPPFHGLYNQKMYFCHLSASAEQAGLYESAASDYFDLRQNDKSARKRLLEFNFGFSAQGYVKLCRQCAGCDAVNKIEVVAANQLPKEN